VNGVANSYSVGEVVTATYGCTDNASGVASCGSATYSSPGTLNTGTLTTPTVDTSSEGSKTFTVHTTDIAGNAGTPASVTYNVVGAYADLEELTFAPFTVKSGAKLAYDIIALDFGPATALNVVIADTLPPGTTFVSAGYESLICAILSGTCPNPPPAPTCAATGGVVTCDPGSIAPLSLAALNGAAVRVLVTVNAKAGTSITNHVAVTSANPNQYPAFSSSSQKTSVTK
jgi:uncharacterized repeat protein (TIGR01451 family)